MLQRSIAPAIKWSDVPLIIQSIRPMTDWSHIPLALPFGNSFPYITNSIHCFYHSLILSPKAPINWAFMNLTLAILNKSIPYQCQIIVYDARLSECAFGRTSKLKILLYFTWLRPIAHLLSWELRCHYNVCLIHNTNHGENLPSIKQIPLRPC